MKSVFAAAVSSAILGAATAQQQSGPFTLVIQSEEAKYNQQTLAACHSGAGLASLCLIEETHRPNPENTFYLNSTDSSPVGSVGTLTWNEPFNSPNTEYISQAFSIWVPFSTNVGQAFFGFSPGQGFVSIGFDSDNLMTIVDPYNDTVQPPTDETDCVYMRWYVCPTNFEGYAYTTLNWLFGTAQPQNAGCRSVKVQRVNA